MYGHKYFRVLVALLVLLSFSTTVAAQCEDFEGSITVNDPLCNGDSTGAITVVTEGGTGGNTYSILPDSFSIGVDGIASDLPSGEYTISVTDEVGCELEFDLTIYEPDSMYFSELGFNHAYCRAVGDYESHGVVYGGASGGTPDYNYEWTFLETGETTVSTTWGARNPGEYQMKVTDSNGCLLIGNLTLDSLNPQANFDIISGDVWEIPYGYAGNAPVSVVCENTSMYGQNPMDPFTDTAQYRWHMHNYADWITTGYDFEPSITYEFENLWGIKLAMKSGNGCLDTAHQFIAVFGPLSINDSDEIAAVSIIPNESNGSINIRKKGFDKGVQVRLYDTSGKLLLDKIITDETEIVPFNMVKGVYLYEFTNIESSERIGSGKFVY